MSNRCNAKSYKNVVVIPHVCYRMTGHGGDHQCGLMIDHPGLERCRHTWKKKNARTRATRTSTGRGSR